MHDIERSGSGRAIPILIVAIVLVAVLGIGGTVMGFSAARRERMAAETQRAIAEESRARAVPAEELAEAQRARAMAINDFVIASLKSSDSGHERDLTVHDAITLALKKVESGEPDEPTVRNLLDTIARILNDTNRPDAAAGAIHASLGNAYASLGDLDAAEEHLKTAVELRTRALGEDAAEVVTDREALARVLERKAK